MFSKPSLEILSKLSFECWSARLQIEFFQVLFQFATEMSWSENGVNEAPETPKANENDTVQMSWLNQWFMYGFVLQRVIIKDWTLKIVSKNPLKKYLHYIKADYSGHYEYSMFTSDESWH